MKTQSLRLDDVAPPPLPGGATAARETPLIGSAAALGTTTRAPSAAAASLCAFTSFIQNYRPQLSPSDMVRHPLQRERGYHTGDKGELLLKPVRCLPTTHHKKKTPLFQEEGVSLSSRDSHPTGRTGGATVLCHRRGVVFIFSCVCCRQPQVVVVTVKSITRCREGFISTTSHRAKTGCSRSPWNKT